MPKSAKRINCLTYTTAKCYNVHYLITRLCVIHPAGGREMAFAKEVCHASIICAVYFKL